MGHLVGHVLSTPETFGVDTDLCQEEVSPSQEVSEGLVVDDSLCGLRLMTLKWGRAYLGNSIADGHLGQVRASI